MQRLHIEMTIKKPPQGRLSVFVVVSKERSSHWAEY